MGVTITSDSQAVFALWSCLSTEIMIYLPAPSVRSYVRRSGYTDLTEAVKNQITGLTTALQKDGLKINPFAVADPGRRKGKQKSTDAAAHLRRGAELFLAVHGLTVVSEGEAAAWVVCQYRRSEGAAVPEHLVDRTPRDGW